MIAAASPAIDGGEQLFHVFVARFADAFLHVLERDLGQAAQLVQQGNGVAEPSLHVVRDRAQRGAVDLHVLLVGDVLQAADDVFFPDLPELKPLAARLDGGRDLVEFGGGEDEVRVRGWFLERFEQRVERFLREHVHFVDDVDLRGGNDGGELDFLEQAADIVDAAIARRVDFHAVHEAAFVRRVLDLPLQRFVFHAPGEHGFGEDARDRRLARPARAREQIGVGEFVLGDGLFQRGDDVLLAADVREAFGPVRAVERHGSRSIPQCFFASSSLRFFLIGCHSARMRKLLFLTSIFLLAACVDTTGLTSTIHTDVHPSTSQNALVTVTEYADLQCPACRSAHATLVQPLIAKYGTKIAYDYRHFPLTSIHRYAMEAAEASECAADQGKFWEFMDPYVRTPERFVVRRAPRMGGRTQARRRTLRSLPRLAHQAEGHPGFLRRRPRQGRAGNADVLRETASRPTPPSKSCPPRSTRRSTRRRSSADQGSTRASCANP
jgi:hypothetical protein